MSEPNPNKKEIKKTIKLLQGIKEIASESSLTGSLSGGTKMAVQQYNAILARMTQIGEIPPALFSPLPEEASLDECGVAAFQLASYLHEEEEEDHSAPHINGPNNSPTFIINGALGAEGLEQFKDIGKMIREHLPEWIRGPVEANTEGVKAGVTPPTPPAPPSPPSPPSPVNVATQHAIPASLREEAHPAHFVEDDKTVKVS